MQRILIRKLFWDNSEVYSIVLRGTTLNILSIFHKLEYLVARWSLKLEKWEIKEYKDGQDKAGSTWRFGDRQDFIVLSKKEKQRLFEFL